MQPKRYGNIARNPQISTYLKYKILNADRGQLCNISYLAKVLAIEKYERPLKA